MADIEELLRSLIDQHRSIDIVESEFKRMLNEDNNLKDDYIAWCEDEGYSYRSGYHEFIQQMFDSENSIWDTFIQFEDEN